MLWLCWFELLKLAMPAGVACVGVCAQLRLVASISDMRQKLLVVCVDSSRSATTTSWDFGCGFFHESLTFAKGL